MALCSEGYNGPLMLSDRVLCDYMPYDAKTNKNAETGSHRRNSWRDNFGSNHWRDSNIRSWLNSNAEAGKVKWLCGNPPTEDSVYPKTAAYDQKEGFLRSFRSDELGAIRTVKQRSMFPIRSIRQVISTQPVLIFPITPQLIR